MMETAAQQSPRDSRRRRRLSEKKAPVHKCKDCYLPDTASDDCSLIESSPCEACPYCADTCGDDGCKLCVLKRVEIKTPTCPPQSAEPVYTLCQVRRHCTEKSCWIVAGNDIYDVTTYMNRHPGGKECILRKAGGSRDCADDFQFHSKAGRKAWNRYKVGTLVPCPGHEQKVEEKPWWQFWAQ